MKSVKVLVALLLTGCFLLVNLVGVGFAQGESAVIEEVITLENGISATFAAPESEEAVPAVLMLHGFASSKDEVGGMYQRLAASLAEQGIASLRIDFRGWGESEGGMENSTVQGMVEDAATGYEYLAALEGVDSAKIGVIGFSLGGRIAIVSAAQNPDWYQSMALWSNGGNIPADFLGQEAVDAAQADGQAVVDLGWTEVTLGADFFESLSLYDMEEEFPKYAGPVFIVAGSTDEDPATYLDWYLENAAGSLRAAYMVEGGDHIYATLTEDQTMSDDVIEQTADWFALSLD